MSEERGPLEVVAEIVPPGTTLALPSQVAPEKAADAAIALLDARERVARKLREVAIRRTQASDWVDQDGKPHLQAVGVERQRSLFGVSVMRTAADDKTWDTAEDGTRFYTWTANVKATMRDPLTGVDMTQEAVGSCTSRDKFLGKKGGEYKPWDEVDDYSVHSKAVTRGERNAVLRLLGLRGITWDDLAAARIVRGAPGMATVTHATGKEGGGAVDPSTEAQHKAIKDLATRLGENMKAVWQRVGIARPKTFGEMSAVDAGKVIAGLQAIEREMNEEAAKREQDTGLPADAPMREPGEEG